MHPFIRETLTGFDYDSDYSREHGRRGWAMFRLFELGDLARFAHITFPHETYQGSEGDYGDVTFTSVRESFPIVDALYVALVTGLITTTDLKQAARVLVRYHDMLEAKGYQV